MRILIAPNAFKNSLGAPAVAAAIQEGFLKSRLSCSCECFPIGDGGDGTAALIIEKLGGTMLPVTASDPLGRPVSTAFGLIDNGHTAVIEMADASGLRLLQPDELNPLLASSGGTGEMIKAALDSGVHKIIIGMGGSATVDGGCGILKAVGMRFLDAAGKNMDALPANLTALAAIDSSGLDRRLKKVETVVLCDVTNVLLGTEGAATVFGPQKGATPQALLQLEAGLAVLASVAQDITGKNMGNLLRGGTAGGAAAGLHVLANAALVNGIDYFLQLTDFDTALQNCDVLVTGEGCIDEQTLGGKGPYGVALRAKQKNIPVIGMAGKIELKSNSLLRHFFDALLQISEDGMNPETARRLTGDNLLHTATEAGNLLAEGKLF